MSEDAAFAFFPEGFVPDEVNGTNITFFITPPCFMCNAGSSGVVLPVEDFTAWKLGKFIQDAFPYLNDSQRELLMSGTHMDGCQDKLFGTEDD